MKSNKTRERILDASLALFNAKKASNVSTVQISAAMNISPGNLYYYYANKEEVIRCIWQERMVEKIEVLLENIKNMETAKDLFDCLEANFRHIAEYKFFYTEMPTLFINDNQMIELYKSVEVKIIETLFQLYEKWNNAGLMIDIPEEEKSIIAENLTALSHKMISCYDMAEVFGRGFDDFMKSAWIRIIYFLKPYFTESMKEDLRKEMSAREISLKKYYEGRRQY